MQYQTVKLPTGEAIRVDWSKAYFNVQLAFEGRTLVTVTKKADLELGQKITLPNGQTVILILAQNRLELWHNHHELLSSVKSGTVDHFKLAVQYLYAISIFQIVILSVTWLFMYLNNEKWQINGYMVFFVIKAVAIALLGYTAAKAKSITPLWIAVGIFGWLIINNLSQMDFISAIFWAGLIYLVHQGIAAGPLQPSNIQKLDENSPLDASA